MTFRDVQRRQPKELAKIKLLSCPRSIEAKLRFLDRQPEYQMCTPVPHPLTSANNDRFGDLSPLFHYTTHPPPFCCCPSISFLVDARAALTSSADSAHAKISFTDMRSLWDFGSSQSHYSFKDCRQLPLRSVSSTCFVNIHCTCTLVALHLPARTICATQAMMPSSSTNYALRVHSPWSS